MENRTAEAVMMRVFESFPVEYHGSRLSIPQPPPKALFLLSLFSLLTTEQGELAPGRVTAKDEKRAWVKVLPDAPKGEKGNDANATRQVS